MGDNSRAIDGCEEGHSAPCEGMLVTRDADDAKMRRWGEVFDCPKESRRYVPERSIHLPIIELATAPHPVSPKFKMTLCRRAAYTCLASNEDGVYGADTVNFSFDTEMNSTRSHRFYD